MLPGFVAIAQTRGSFVLRHIFSHLTTSLQLGAPAFVSHVMGTSLTISQGDIQQQVLVASGDRGADSIVYNEGGNAAKWARSGAAHLHKTVGNIPADLLSKAQLKAASSRPDIVLYQRKSVRRTPEIQWMTSQAQVTLIEVSTQGTLTPAGHTKIHINSMSV